MTKSLQAGVRVSGQRTSMLRDVDHCPKCLSMYVKSITKSHDLMKRQCAILQGLVQGLILFGMPRILHNSHHVHSSASEIASTAKHAACCFTDNQGSQIRKPEYLVEAQRREVRSCLLVAEVELSSHYICCGIKECINRLAC